MLNVLLVRHGVTEATGERLGGRTAATLSEDGTAQARAAAQRFAALPVVAVYASPITRTMQTAGPIAAAHDLEIGDLEGVQEVDYGRWTDRPLDEARDDRLWPIIQRRPSRVTFPGGESIREAQSRAVDAVESVVARHDPGGRDESDESDESGESGEDATGDGQDAEPPPPPVVVIVSHADVIKAVVSHYLGQPLDLFQRLVVGPASVSALLLSKTGTPRLVAFNDTAHLRGAA